MQGMHLTAFPVFHGDRSPGASMLLFETADAGGKRSRVLFTGDVLYPRDLSPVYMITPHMQTERDGIVHEYFDRFIQDMNRPCPLSLLEFSLRLQCKEICMVHYGGAEDKKYHRAGLLTPAEGEVIHWPAG